MEEKIVELYKKLLFTFPTAQKEFKTYAIVDSLRDKEIKKELLISNLNHTSLWHKELIQNELKTPLYLIELEKENALTAYLLKKHDYAIATYFVSPCSINDLKEYYAPLTYLNIEIEENIIDRGVFGFYDPNIFSNYIETLHNQEKIDEFFSPILFCLTPKIDDALLAHFSFKMLSGEVENITLLLKNFIDQDVSLDFKKMSIPNGERPYLPYEVEIDYLQVSMFDNMQKTVFINKVLKEFEEDSIVFEPNKYDFMQKSHELFDEANQLAIYTEAGIYRFMLIGLSLSDPCNAFQFYADLVESNSEFDKINIMDETLLSMKSKG